MDKKNPYHAYVDSFLKTFNSGVKLPLGGIYPPSKSSVNPTSPKVVILSPHPDDECVMGPLALRLMREVGSPVCNIPITFGSNPQRKSEREKELAQTCEWLGFQIKNIKDGGLDHITPEARSKNSEYWKDAVEKLSELLQQINPDILFFPNATDWNRTHLGVHLLTQDYLNQNSSRSIILIETEFWGQIREPNFLVESSKEEVGDLVAALSHHKGEVKRNPFHLRMPAWMQDNVRRGAEVVGGQGGDAPNFDFATLYRVSRLKDGKIFLPWQGGRLLPKSKNGHSEILRKLQ